MANIKNLQMWNDICAESRISISKSMFGLKTNVTYVPTQSAIEACTLEYSPEDGEHLKRIIESTKDGIEKAIGNFRPREVPNGNYLLEVAKSQDTKFVALLLQQFVQLSYEPVTKTLIFEGDEAKAISKMLFGNEK